jgi:hypothetical protein
VLIWYRTPSSVPRTSALGQRSLRKKSGQLQRFLNGETRTRTGDTRIFRQAWKDRNEYEESCKLARRAAGATSVNTRGCQWLPLGSGRRGAATSSSRPEADRAEAAWLPHEDEQREDHADGHR